MPASTSEPADRLTGALPRQEEKIPAPPAPRPRPPLPARVGLRRPGATFLGVRIGESQAVTLPDDVTVVARPGDWIVQVGHVPISVVSSTAFPAPYELVEEGSLTLSRLDREDLDGLLGLGASQSADALVAAARRLARLSIGEVDLPFTPGQLEELHYRAGKRGQTVAQAVEAVVDRIKDELFWKG